MTKPATNNMERTWLVQRLTKPWPTPRGEKSLLALFGENPFAFGGGYKNGGLSNEAMALLRPCFGFDYMGSAEYEFGAVPQALGTMAGQADNGDLEAWIIQVDRSTIHPGWDKQDKPGTGLATVYVLGDGRRKDEITRRIQWVATEHGPNTQAGFGIGYKHVQFKEVANFGRRLLERDEYLERVIGWLELDNGFCWFIDEQQWALTAAIFGVETGVDILCGYCGRDDRNGTHAALEKAGHLSHPFDPNAAPGPELGGTP